MADYIWQKKDKVIEMIYPKGRSGPGVPLSNFGSRLNKSNIFGCFLSEHVRKVPIGEWYERGLVSRPDLYDAIYKALLKRLERYKTMKPKCKVRIRIFEGENTNEASVNAAATDTVLRNHEVKSEDAYL